MKRRLNGHPLVVTLLLAPASIAFAQPTSLPATQPAETPAQRDARMAWWRESRFGLFIHWGLYAVPAGEWGGKTDYGEWIRHFARIPIDEYDKLAGRFNPVKFNADQWVRMAKDAGMKYIVITSKHHDGFCLFDSQHTEFDVMSTPFKRDVLKELAQACDRAGIRLCFYHSIMDWRHPDYWPRREWETRPGDPAGFDRYVGYMKDQLRELLTRYGPIGVLWFDGQWEETWTHARGLDLHNFVRGLQPKIMINNRVDVGRGAVAGMTKDGFAGDFGTPEQEIPAAGFPGVDWESCMTMNDHWGWNRHDKDWKSSAELLRMLADIASKGGNFLLNIGPTAEGEFPPESVERLKDIGAWMNLNGEAIYGTQAGPFRSLPWGGCTQKKMEGGRTRLYLIVLDWPSDGRLVLPGLQNETGPATLPGADSAVLPVEREGVGQVVDVRALSPGRFPTMIRLDVSGKPDVGHAPLIEAEFDSFVDGLDVAVRSEQENVELRYTLDGAEPVETSPRFEGSLRVTATTTVNARAFRDGKAVSEIGQAVFRRVEPQPAAQVTGLAPGLMYDYYEGEWDTLPQFPRLAPTHSDVSTGFDLSPRKREERFGFRFRGYVTVPKTGMYRFWVNSDDGSRLYINRQVVVENDGLHGPLEATGAVALEAGAHPLVLEYFEQTGGQTLEVTYAGPGTARQRLPDSSLSHVKE